MRSDRVRTVLLCLPLVILVILSTCGAMAQARRPASGGRNCGAVTPPLPSDLHEGYSFFEVTARDLHCGPARHVARRYVELTNHATPPLPVDRRVFGFRCTVSSNGGIVTCRRGRAVAVGHNGGF
ncbi:MAG TPA: hypothetical protein VMH33_07505 [Solirubrobacterales bacterium]|nr:hypothetical protein [Solirubrobacterales bacterium]